MSSNAAVHRRANCGLWAAILLLNALARSAFALTAAAQPGSTPTSAPAANTAATPATFLSRFVPADTGFYVEATNAGDLLLALAEPELWSALAEIAGQPAAAEDSLEWERRVEQSLGLKPRAAIQLLLADRVAFVGESTGGGQDAIILCTPSQPLDDSMQHWGAERVPRAGAASVFRLRSGVGLATAGAIACFGDPRPKAGVFANVLQCLDGAARPRLADEPPFRTLLSRVPAEPTALLFARLDLPILARQPTTQASSQNATSPPASQLTAPASAASQPRFASALPIPVALRDSRHILLAMHRAGPRLDFTVTGDAPPASRAPDAAPFRPVARPPADCLLSWQGSIDYPALLELGRTLPERSVLRLALRILERTAGLHEFADALGAATGFFIGAPTSAESPAGAPPIPALGVVIALDDEATAERRMQTLSDAASVYNLLALNSGWALLDPVRALDLDGVAVQALDLKPLWRAQPKAGWLGDVQLCWTIYDGALLFATDVEWMKTMLAARRDAGDSPPSGQGQRLSTGPAAPLRAPDEGLYASTGGLAALARQWLDFIAARQPELLDPSWWRALQPGLQNPRLGLSVSQDAEQRRLDLTSMETLSPARAVLRVGDRIVGVSGRRFATSQPAQEFRDGIETRPHAGWLELLVERDGGVLVRRIRLPFVNPIQLLRRVIAVGGIVDQVVYTDDRDAAGHPSGHLTLRLSDSPAIARPVVRNAASNASAPAPAAPARIEPTAN